MAGFACEVVKFEKEVLIFRLKSLKSSTEAMLGYSAAISSLVGGVPDCPMGIPLSKGKVHPTFCFVIVKITIDSYPMQLLKFKVLFAS